MFLLNPCPTAVQHSIITVFFTLNKFFATLRFKLKAKATPQYMALWYTNLYFVYEHGGCYQLVN